MTDEQLTAKALLETPEVFKYLSGNEIRVCERLLEDSYYLTTSGDFPPMDEDEEEVVKAIRADAATFHNLENTFPREIAAWKANN